MTAVSCTSRGRVRGGLRGASTTTCESRQPRGERRQDSRRVLVEDVRHAIGLGKTRHSGSLGQSRRTRRESLFSDGGGFGGLGNIMNNDVEYEIGSKVRVAKEVRIFHVRGCGPEGFNLEGSEGTVVDRADLHKGTTTTANLPYKVKLELEVAGKKKKVFAHLKKLEIEAVEE